jgi:hypothetical protein
MGSISAGRSAKRPKGRANATYTLCRIGRASSGGDHARRHVCFVPLLRSSAAFRRTSVFRGVGDVELTRITKAAIACQNIASAVAVLE